MHHRRDQHDEEGTKMPPNVIHFFAGASGAFAGWVAGGGNTVSHTDSVDSTSVCPTASFDRSYRATRANGFSGSVPTTTNRTAPDAAFASAAALSVISTSP